MLFLVKAKTAAFLPTIWEAILN